MKPIPQTENPLIIRTDFSDRAVWEEICAIVRMPVGIFGFRANVEFLDDVAYADLTKSQLLELLPSDYDHTLLIVADKNAISLPDHPLLVIDLHEGSGNEFRALPSRIQGIENNLSIANMDFEEFAGSVDEDGVFRGFPKS
ncbi:MAG TPA: hypothetical protein VFO91_14385 [Anaerolineales bacterium]|nr:hypothetical protein [Anaerolineales bacterium]